MASNDLRERAGPWKRAASFAELLTLTARFLRGEPIGFPGWAVEETDEESDGLLPVLLAANGAGMLSVASQPGAPFGPGHDGWSWGGRAFVGGFARSEDARSIRDRAEAAGLWARDGASDGPFEIPAGLRDGSPYLVLGSDARDEELSLFDGEVGAGALAELRETSFLWVIDPVWGRRERLRAAF
ncbi:hypothetical protein Poly30_32940 [Planctomycetes bacterium Poly30]|uniref:DUF6919 domain-containing protein n=1 Tax=Saltatorellus ferox TaxID=2528018 RepID=A0A518EUI9_9BACT|nr:hypothetical protein Poly30_32940 [Planctomycetes bacterium Poly30]